MKIFITGGGGFLGTAICKKLREKGYDVVSFSRKPHQHLADIGVEHKQGSVTDLNAVVWSSNECDAIIHTAAKAGVWGSMDSFYEPNVIGTENIVSACQQHTIDRLVYTSSPSVVFNGTDMEGIDESQPYPVAFDSPYPQTKALAEQHILAANGPELATIALRPHLIWGPGDPHLVKRIVTRGNAGKLRKIGSDPKRVDTVYVDNAADAHVHALERLKPGAACAGKAYFISNGEPIPTWEIVGRILRAANAKPVTRSISVKNAMRLATVLEKIYRIFNSESEPLLTRFVVKELSTAHWFDITAAQRDLDYFPEVSIQEGLKRLKSWFDAGGYNQ